MGRSFWFADWWPIICVCVVALAGVLFSAIAYLQGRRPSRRRSARRTRSAMLLLLGCASLLILLMGGFFLIQFGGYHRLTEWEVVARVQCSPRDKFQKFELTYTTLADGRQRSSRVYEVYGDRWSIQADMVEWKPFMSRLGLRRSFKFSRLEGRFDRQQASLEHPITRIALANGSDRIWLRFHHGEPRWPFRYFVRSVYTSTASNDPAPGVLFDIVGAKDGVGLRKVDY